MAGYPTLLVGLCDPGSEGNLKCLQYSLHGIYAGNHTARSIGESIIPNPNHHVSGHAAGTSDIQYGGGTVRCLGMVLGFMRRDFAASGSMQFEIMTAKIRQEWNRKISLFEI